MSTKNKRLMLALISIVMTFGMVLSACKAATPTEQEVIPTFTALPIPPTYTPYAEEEAEEEAEEVVATEEPEEEAVTGYVNAFGVTLPDDAAPPDQQHITLMGYEGTNIDFFVSVYKRGYASSLLNTPFVRLNKNFEILPAGALSWDQNDDGTVWTFYMDPDLYWNDGNPVLADDVVFSFQYGADPEHAWDFTWFWGDIKNWNEAVAGEVPLDEIGVKKIDDYTVEFTLTAPAPYFLSKALYVRSMSKVAYEAHGEYYNNTPETSVTNTPWKLTEWTKGKQLVYGPNLDYTGKLEPYIEGVTIIFAEPGSGAGFAAYLNNEIDTIDMFTPADIQMIFNDEDLKSQYHAGFGDFRTYYLGFNTYEAPFDDLKVRQAFSMAIDRESISANIVGVQGTAAYSFLMAGFPAADPNAYKDMDVNQFDPEAARALLAEAGYADGEGFPKLELWLRSESDFNQAVGAAAAAMLTENLGIEVEVSNKESKLFMDALNGHTLPFYMVSYGFDYLDPSNMLGIWTSSGRHAWLNEEFDSLIAEASSLIGDDETRTQMFKDAEAILVEDVGGAFIYHVTPGQIYRPYFAGVELEPDNVGISAIHWPNFEVVGSLIDTIYITKDVENYRP